MTDNHDNIVQAIGCEFKIIQSPDLQHLRIKIQPMLPDSHLDEYMLSLKLFPNLDIEKAQALETLLDDCVESLWVAKTSGRT